jgi:hypothetical protein
MANEEYGPTKCDERKIGQAVEKCQADRVHAAEKQEAGVNQPEQIANLMIANGN